MEKYLLESNPRKYTFISSASVGNKDFGDYAIEKEQARSEPARNRNWRNR